MAVYQKSVNDLGYSDFWKIKIISENSPGIEQIAKQLAADLKRKIEDYPEQRYFPHATKKPKKSTNIQQYKNPMEYFNHIFAGALPVFSFTDESDPTTKMLNFKVRDIFILKTLDPEKVFSALALLSKLWKSAIQLALCSIFIFSHTFKRNLFLTGS